jgi:ADP-ribose pyrophosphatase
MSRIIASHDYGPKRFRWLTLKLIEWMDPTGKPRLWESCERTTRAATGVDAVAIVVKAISSKTFSSPKTILVSQYRPSLASTCYELPAGLIDRGETAETAAFRELQEETGLTVTRLLSISPVCCSDPGMTNTNMQLAVVEVDLDSPLNQNAQQKLGDGEFIDMLEAPWEGLLPWLIKQKSDKNVEIDARLMSFAIGFDLGSITSGI